MGYNITKYLTILQTKSKQNHDSYTSMLLCYKLNVIHDNGMNIYFMCSWTFGWAFTSHRVKMH